MMKLTKKEIQCFLNYVDTLENLLHSQNITYDLPSGDRDLITKVFGELNEYEPTNEKMKNKEIKKLKEYKEAYYFLMQYWDSFEEEQRHEINDNLNKIFKLNKQEQYNPKNDFYGDDYDE